MADVETPPMRNIDVRVEWDVDKPGEPRSPHSVEKNGTALGELRIPKANAPEAAERFSPHFWDPQIPHVTIRYAILKRLLDVIFASVALLLLAVVMIPVAIAIKLEDRGPVIFRRACVGRGGRLYWCYKFRSMCVDAEQKKQELLAKNEMGGPFFKMKEDPRVTRVGAFIRKRSIDELPQFVNVLQGDMSIVGPRMLSPEETVGYSQRNRLRFAVRPGLTCIWQVSGRATITAERRMEMDVEYVETMSLWGDIKLILQTIPVVLTGRGAY